MHELFTHVREQDILIKLCTRLVRVRQVSVRTNTYRT